MRILFAAMAEKTHFLGMVPLAWALQNAGHEVRVASQPEMIDVITSAGLTGVPVGKNHVLHRISSLEKTLDLDIPAFDMSEDRPEELTWDYVKPGYTQFVRWWWRVINEPMITDLARYCRQWRPDLVIWEPITYAAPIAARASGAVHARLMWGIDVFSRMRKHYVRLRDEQPVHDRRDEMRDWLTTRVETLGGTYSEEMITGQFTIDYHPPSLRLDTGVHYVGVRYIPYNGVSVLPAWLRQPAQRPRVCITLGTAAAERLGGYFISVQDVLDSLADLDIEVVATLPSSEQAHLRQIPDNARIVEFVPLHLLVPTCSVVIHHGGGGSYCTSLVNGVPQLVLPNLFDAPLRGRNLADQGAGLMIPHADVTGPKVREHVQRLLRDPSFRDNAARLRAEALAMPTPNDLVPEIERLTSRYATRVPARAVTAGG